MDIIQNNEVHVFWESFIVLRNFNRNSVSATDRADHPLLVGGHLKPVKRFQMDVGMSMQHTGLQSTQTRRNTGKQGAQTRDTRHIFPSIPTSVAALHVYKAVHMGTFSELNAHSMRIGSIHIVSDNLRTESHRIQCALSQSTS